MRTFVHLLLFACAIAIAVGTFGPLLGTVEARHVRLSDLRNGFGSGQTIDQAGNQSVSLVVSLAIVLLGVALVVLLAALFGSRVLGWLGVLAGLASLGVLTWRLDEQFDHELRTDYRTLLSGSWGLYLVGGGLVLAVLCLLAPRERVVRAIPRS
ncbi:hypothetical protein [Nocardia sp. NBC_01388]|uniref:hypothetical protein n=1 Tax=Nocardia sp. NBC_01388 TaxID=2903596 RepID=UPI0032499EB4